MRVVSMSRKAACVFAGVRELSWRMG
jgi:hypothetical protein